MLSKVTISNYLRKTSWGELVEKALRDELLNSKEALSILQVEDDDLLELLHAAFKVRKAVFRKKS